MNKVLSMIALVFALVLTSCGASSGYDMKEAEDLCKKIENKEAFSQEDYAKAIALLKAGISYTFDGMADIDMSDADEAQKKISEFTTTEESKAIDKTSGTIMEYVYTHRDDLDEANSKALSDFESYAQQRAQELQSKVLNK